MSDSDKIISFESLGLPEPILKALDKVGYETPSPIQAASIPHLLSGRDILGTAQTGTGKTAAFALPLLSSIDVSKTVPQLLVLTPTRELAIQVAEAFQTYAKYLKDFHILPIYGGQSYDIQLRQLKRGVHVVVGTPGRVMDHIRRGSLKLNTLTSLVLDEADEMLRMGFIDDVEWILDHVPEKRQVALFSATMPTPIKKVANKYLKDAVEVKIAAKTTTATTITQEYLRVNGSHKLEALTRVLEAEHFDALLIFVRTKSATEELAEKLSARGYAAEALNGDIQQQQREKIVDRLKTGKIDILVGTDVVARGLDVERISHVLNYDIPHDTESYVHRIGRTGRAGREGKAILFVTPREGRMLNSIEKTTKQPLTRMEVPSVNIINERRIERFKTKINNTLDNEDISFYLELLSEYQKEHDTDIMELAAALAVMASGGSELLLDEKKIIDFAASDNKKQKKRSDGERNSSRKEMRLYKIMVGKNHKVQPKNIVGAMANEAGLNARSIGQIELYEEFSTVELPKDTPKDIIQNIKKVHVCGKKLDIQEFSRDGNGNRGQKPNRKRSRGR